MINHTDEALHLGSAVPFGAVNLLTGGRPTVVPARGVAVLKVGRE
jgi:hypothetical protein